ncbi:AraC family transcriptional regulator with amidase-like domain [Sphingomonas sp. PP-F2F-A104-K0414]|uniref:GlxA family transcriptional regulator n=1 Tax=Sphingomonas sp. PP-F2F-A104-K0414 TaxID=2135661 RepID=UPI001052F76B|nr:helix-turn-helix domain-containing protein [Sphingomonas sp. PP-F2F-A104-K0414]TCP99522.1 AraC family transcriptional regulator with amidase-like domain [Sphingomonas sp. PP-F2F-A104-K0414]
MTTRTIIAPRPVEIAIVVRDKVMLGIVHGLTDLFRITDDLSRMRLGVDAPVVRLSHFADTGAGGIMRTFDTVPDAITVTGAAIQPDMPSVIIIPPCETAALGIETDRKWSDWLTARHAAGAVLGSICGGTFLLAQTGLLDGRRATTHLICAPDLATMFPTVQVDFDALLTEEDDLITVGGVMAWTDLGLVVVRRLLGAVAMMETARFMMIDPPGREQRFYSTFSPEMGHGDAAILKTQRHLHARGPLKASVTDMAGWSGLELRTFARRFHGATGLRPNEYHQRLRIEKAREMLETTTTPINQVAYDVGYGDPGSFRLTFSKLMGLSPRDYRKRFGHTAGLQP